MANSKRNKQTKQDKREAWWKKVKENEQQGGKFSTLKDNLAFFRHPRGYLKMADEETTEMVRNARGKGAKGQPFAQQAPAPTVPAPTDESGIANELRKRKAEARSGNRMPISRKQAPARIQRAVSAIKQGGARFKELPMAGDSAQDSASEEYKKFQEKKEGYTDKGDIAFHPERLSALAYQKDKSSPSPLTRFEDASLYSENRAKARQQKKSFDPYEDTNPRRSFDRTGGFERAGLKGGGKLAGNVLNKLAQHAIPASSTIIYGLAILNDVPDLADWVLEALLVVAGGLGPIVDFLFDVVVFLGFRYFLREHINISGIRLLLWGGAALEFLPGPLDIFPFWTICAWLALRKIDEENKNKKRAMEQGANRYAAGFLAPRLRVNRIRALMGSERE